MIQTYEPSSPGMIICISGGEYVKTTDHLAAMEEKDAEIRKKDNLICEQGMQIEETYKVLEGEVVCDFAMSFGLVDRAAGLKESLRLSELRGESLDRVVAEGVQKELKLENEIAELKALPRYGNDEVLRLKTIADAVDIDGTTISFASICDSIDSKTLEEAVYSLCIYHIRKVERQDKEIADLKFDLSKPPQERTYCKECALPRLTAALDDDERAERIAVGKKYDETIREIREDAINDYRAMLKEEVEG